MGGISQNIAGDHGIPGILDPFNDPLNLTGKHTPPLTPLPTAPDGSLSAGDLNKINYDQQLVLQRQLTSRGQQSTILTSPTGLAPNPLAAGMGKSGVAPPKTLLGG